jgi:5S rRNA maturation endonuclease (ribonuclease M5)
MFYNPISRRNSTKRVKIQRVSEATIVFEYDNYGNILRKKIYRYLPKVSTEDLSSDQLEQIIE